MSPIHPTALIDPQAQLANNVQIGPYTTVEAGVQVGEGCVIGAYVTLGQGLRLGARAKVYNYACLSTASQDLKHQGGASFVQIGADAVVREFVTVNRGTRPGSTTLLGDHVVLMAYSHVAHECRVGNHVILVNAATLGGEVEVADHAIVGGLVGVHQFCRIGAHSIIGANSKITQDVPPYLLVDGHPARPYGPNVIGLRRRGFTDGQIREIHRIYRLLFNAHLPLEESCELIQRQYGDSQFAAEILDFCQTSKRGITRPRHRPNAPAMANSTLTPIPREFRLS